MLSHIGRSADVLGSATRVLVADVSPPMQRWIAGSIDLPAARVHTVCVSDGLDLLYHLAEDGPFDLVIANAALPMLSGEQVLAMARTAGLVTPFVLMSALDTVRLRRLVDRAQPAIIVSDPLDVSAVVGAAHRLLASAPPTPSRDIQWTRAMSSLSRSE